MCWSHTGNLWLCSRFLLRFRWHWQRTRGVVSRLFHGKWLPDQPDSEGFWHPSRHLPLYADANHLPHPRESAPLIHVSTDRNYWTHHTLCCTDFLIQLHRAGLWQAFQMFLHSGCGKSHGCGHQPVYNGTGSPVVLPHFFELPWQGLPRRYTEAPDGSFFWCWKRPWDCPFSLRKNPTSSFQPSPQKGTRLQGAADQCRFLLHRCGSVPGNVPGICHS